MVFPGLFWTPFEIPTTCFINIHVVFIRCKYLREDSFKILMDLSAQDLRGYGPLKSYCQD